jgi:hypothetical protein
LLETYRRAENIVRGHEAEVLGVSP